ncbi:acylphosphatase [Candidatus Daviesbacteria bacterium]|nr:acylphosphatase [Candidatus Daviesbacteria bacterium]
MYKHLNIKIYGSVQGVFFRVSSKEEADKLNLTGFAKNMPDGSVYIEIEGEENKLDQFLSWCHEGPNLANVESVLVNEGKVQNFSDFYIR